jgi:isocitrate dehydrogenase
MSQNLLTRTISLIPGDGIGPEVLKSAQTLIDATGLGLQWEYCEAGGSSFAKGISTGVPLETIDSILRNKVALKGPLETPVGYGGKSANVTLRKYFETFANVRPIKELPGIKTPFSGRNIDFVIVRENVEDLYAGIEHMQTPTVSQCLKIITEKGCEKIIRLAFELARSEGRKQVHCATKANIMKMTEGMMKRVFERVSKDYTEIKATHIIIDNCAHQLVISPEQFEVIVSTNLHGDIISDLAAGLVGGLGLAPSANLGNDVCMFEAVHGSAPDIAGKNLANPSSVILSSVMMLRHLGAFKEAALIQDALFYTFHEAKVRTGDIAPKGSTVASTTDFTAAILANFGKKVPEHESRDYKKLDLAHCTYTSHLKPAKTKIIGADIFLASELDFKQLGEHLSKISEPTSFQLKMISNRGTQVYPPNASAVDPVDCSYARFVLKSGKAWDEKALLELLGLISEHYSWVHVEKLQEFDTLLGYSLSQGEAAS